MPQSKTEKKVEEKPEKKRLRIRLPRTAKKVKEKPKAEIRVEAKEKKAIDPWKILKYPHLAEKSMNMVELENKLVFMVHRNATKAQVKEAVEKGFGVKVISVNLEITRKGQKKAYVKLGPEHMAADIASRLGMV